MKKLKQNIIAFNLVYVVKALIFRKYTYRLPKNCEEVYDKPCGGVECNNCDEVYDGWKEECTRDAEDDNKGYEVIDIYEVLETNSIWSGPPYVTFGVEMRRK